MIGTYVIWGNGHVWCVIDECCGVLTLRRNCMGCSIFADVFAHDVTVSHLSLIGVHPNTK